MTHPNRKQTLLFPARKNRLIGDQRTDPHVAFFCRQILVPLTFFLFLCEIKPSNSPSSSNWFRLEQVKFRCTGTWRGSNRTNISGLGLMLIKFCSLSVAPPSPPARPQFTNTTSAAASAPKAAVLLCGHPALLTSYAARTTPVMEAGF